MESKKCFLRNFWAGMFYLSLVDILVSPLSITVRPQQTELVQPVFYFTLSQPLASCLRKIFNDLTRELPTGSVSVAEEGLGGGSSRGSVE